MKKLFTFLFCIGLATQMMAVPARRVTTTVRMSDGSEKVIQLRGDETFHFHTTLDGVPVCKNEDGTWSVDTRDVHALWTEALTKRNKHRQKLAERTRRHLAPRRAGEAPKTKKGLLILVNFTDKKMVNGDNSQSVFDQMLNGLNNPYGKNYGSVREYFQAQSYGHFDIIFDIVGPVTVSQEMSYYGGNDKNGNDKVPEQMVVEACKLVDSQVNFADYDWDGDGEVENIYITYAGYGEASFPEGGKVGENTIWPHQWNLTESTGAPLTLDGVRIDTYACGSELYGISGTTLDGIGTMCHEYSHCLGLPDFYDTDNFTNFGMGSWSIMDSGCYNNDGFCPAGYTAYERWFCGWLEPMVLKKACNVNDLKNIENYPEAYVIYNDANMNEYYLLANHQQTGWDTYACGHGMMITHVDYNANAWMDNTVNNTASRQRMTIIPADNGFSKDENGYYYADDGDLWPGKSGNNSLTDTSMPVAILYNKNSDGQKLMHKPIEDITEENGLISFKFMGGTPLIDAPLATDATDVKPTAFTANWRPVEDAISYNLTLTEIYDDGQEEEESYIEAMNLHEDFKNFMVSSDVSEDISSELDDYTFVPGWTGSKVFQGMKGAKLASSKGAGYLTTPLLDFNSGTMTVIMTVCNYNSDNASPKLICLDEDGEKLLDYDIHPAENNYFSFTLSGGVPSKMKLKISATAGKCIYIGDMYVFDMTLTEKQLSNFINNDSNSPTLNYRQVNKSICKSAPRKATVTTSQFIEGLTGTSFIVTGCKPSTNYTYQVQAVDVEGNASYWSNSISLTTPTNYSVSLIAYSSTIEYGEPIPPLEYISEGADIEGEPAITCEVVQGSPVGTYPIVISQGSITTDNVNYVNGTLTITKAPLTVGLAETYSCEEGEPIPEFELTYSGWKLNETEEVLTEKPMATTTATIESRAGTYPITISGGSAQNYELNYVSGTLTVTQVLHTATITCIGNGVVTCHDDASDEDVTIKDAEMTSVRFSLIDGLDLSILPDLGYQLMRLLVSNIDRTEDVDDEGHIHLDAHGDLNIIAQFVPQSEVVVTMTDANYRIPDLSTDEAEVAGINKAAAHVTIPATVDYRGRTWRITKVADGAFASCPNLVSISIPASVKEAGMGLFEGDTHLAAIEWNSDIPLTRTLLGTLRNPNLLYYVKQKELAEGFSNVITGSNESGWQAEQIQLTDNDAVIHDFYAPKAFTAQRISYTHAYLQETNKGECRGWESLVLPFDVQTITHQKGEIRPFLAYHLNAEDALPDSYLPFWLYEFTEEGLFRAAEAVRANTPYILSMPNDDHNDPHYDLSGSVTFKAENAEVKSSQDAVTVTGNGRTFRPAYQERLTGEGCYVLNVGKTHAGLVEGSVFVRNLRDVRPFEAYFTVDGGAVKEDFFSVFDKTTDIADLFGNDVKDNHANEAVYDLAGRKMNGKTVKAGLYIINGQKRLTK